MEVAHPGNEDKLEMEEETEDGQDMAWTIRFLTNQLEEHPSTLKLKNPPLHCAHTCTTSYLPGISHHRQSTKRTSRRCVHAYLHLQMIHSMINGNEDVVH